MSIDPPYTAEFANAGFLATIPDDLQSQAEAAVVQGCGGRRHLGRPARRRAVLVQHPGALVPQVVRREGRPRHDAAGHVGPDHRCRCGQRRQGRGAGEQVRGLLGLDQRADLRGRRRDRHQHRQGRRPHPRGRLPRGRNRGDDHREAGALPRRAGRPVGLQRGHSGRHVRWAPGSVHGQLDLHLDQLRQDPARGEGRTSASPGTRSRRRARRPGRRTAGSASG